MLFTSFGEFVAGVKFLTDPVPDAMAADPEALGSMRTRVWFRLITQTLVTVFGLLIGVYLTISLKSSEPTRQFGTGLIGMVIGFWLK